MSYTRKPNYHFKTKLDTGINKVPDGMVVIVEDYDGEKKGFIKNSSTGLTASSTIQDAFTGLNIKVSTGGAITSYRFTATEGQTAFVTTGSTLSADPLVYSNGVLQDLGITYTVASKTVTFIDARTVNEKIVIVG